MNNMESIERLREITAILRSENGCPWDKEQTHKSITKDLIEECYELIDAILTEDHEAMKEELGDVLFQVMFHSQIAAENGKFSIQDVADTIAEKLIRRHPHVFSENNDKISVNEVLSNWEEIKKEEKDKKGITQESFLDSIPDSFPALLKAEKLQAKAAKTGFDWDKIQDVEKKLAEELNEFRKELNDYYENSSELLKTKMEDEFGDILFTLVNIGRHLKLSSEVSLNRTNQKFRTRFAKMEKTALESGKDLKNMNLTELDKLWEISKI